MSYFNPVLAYGVDAFARDLAAAGGSGVITPDLIVDEAEPWLAAAHGARRRPDLPGRTVVVGRADQPHRGATSGFLYAASTMGVTGARDQVSSARRSWWRAAGRSPTCRSASGWVCGRPRRPPQIAGFADAVIVGSAFVSAADAEVRTR